MTPATPALGSRQDPGRPARRRRILAFAATRVAAVRGGRDGRPGLRTAAGRRVRRAGADAAGVAAAVNVQNVIGGGARAGADRLPVRRADPTGEVLMSATTAGLLQLGVLLLALAAVYVPFGNYLARVYSDRAALAGGAGRVPGGAGRPRLRAALDRLRRRAARLLLPVRRAAVPAAAAAGAAAAEPGPRPGRPGHRVQHRGVVRDQHQLAVLRARDGDGPPGADGRADRAELRVRGGRAWRWPSRWCAASCGPAATGSATSGSTWSAA